jgi:hypothetical protein
MKARLLDGKLTISSSYSGKKPWAALITGRDPERGFARKFLGVRTVAAGSDSDLNDASITLHLNEGAVYELGAWVYEDGEELRAYYVIKDQRPEKVSAEQVRELFDESDDAEDIDLPF